MSIIYGGEIRPRLSARYPLASVWAPPRGLACWLGIRSGVLIETPSLNDAPLGQPQGCPLRIIADGVRFELTVPLRGRQFSRLLP